MINDMLQHGKKEFYDRCSVGNASSMVIVPVCLMMTLGDAVKIASTR